MRNYVNAFIIGCLLFGCYIQASAQNDYPLSNILVINSYSPTQDRINKVLPAYLNQMELYPDVNINVEYLCYKQYSNIQHWKTWLENKLNLYYTYPDIVVILGQEAWLAYRMVCPNDWKQIPIILGNTTIDYYDFIQHSEQTYNITKTFEDYKVKGYFYKKYINENAQLIHELQPDIKRITVLSDNPFGIKINNAYLSTVKIPNLYFNNISNDDNVDELLDQIKRYPDNNTLLCNGYETDLSPNFSNNCYQIRTEISKLNNNVIYSLSDCDFNNPSVLGGFFVSGTDLGNDLAALTKQMLADGFDSCPKFKSTPSAPRYYVNTLAISKLGYSESNMIFKNMNLVNSYSEKMFLKYQFITSIILISAFFIFIICLIILYMRRRNKQLGYKYNQQLDKYVSTIPDMTVIINGNYKIKDVNNPLNCFNNYKSIEDIIGHTIDVMLSDLVHFSFIENAKRNIDYVIKQKESITGIYTIIFPGQPKKYIQYTMAPFEQDSVICYQRNATQHMRSKFKKGESQKIMQNILNNIPTAISVKSADNNFKYILCNKRFTQNQSLSENIIGKNDFELNIPDAQKINDEEKRMCINNIKTPLMLKNVVYNDHNEPIWEEYIQKVLFSIQEKKYLISIGQNSTPDDKYKYELQYLKNGLNLGLKTGLFSVWTFNFKNRLFRTFLFPNKMAFSLEHFYKNIEHGDRIKVSELIHNIEIGLKKSGFITLKHRYESSYKWFKFYFHAISSKRFQCPEQVFIIAQDITEDQQRLLDFEYGKICANIALNCCGFSSWEYNILTKDFASESPLSIFYGRMSENTFYMHLHPEDKDTVKKMLADLISGREASTSIKIRHIISSEKKYQWIEMNATRLYSSEQTDINPTVVIGTYRDITEDEENKQLFPQLQQQLEEYKQDNYAFINNVCQNLRSPLNSILEFSSLLVENKDNNHQDEFIRIIHENHRILTRLINNLLDIAHIKTGNMYFNPTSVKINDIVNYMIQLYSLRISNDILLSTSMPAIACSILCDKTRLCQVISSCLDFSINHIKKGSIVIGYKYAVDISIFVRVSGLADKDYELDLFENSDISFYTNSENIELSICKNIIERMGGNIRFHSTNTDEYEFTISFPAKMMN